MSDLQIDKKIELLYKAIEDNQNTIRFTDTKAGAILVLIGIYFALSGSVAKDFFSSLKKLYYSGTIVGSTFFWIYCVLFLISSLFVIGSTIVVFKVISPKSNPSSSVDFDISSANPKSVYYLVKFSPKINLFNVFNEKKGFFRSNDKASEVKNTINQLTDDSVLDILIFELQKISFIREMKIQRVRIAILMLIISCSVSFGSGILFLIQKIIGFPQHIL